MFPPTVKQFLESEATPGFRLYAEKRAALLLSGGYSEASKRETHHLAQGSTQYDYLLCQGFAILHARPGEYLIASAA